MREQELHVYKRGYRDGIHALSDQVHELAHEQFQAGKPWPAGTVLTAQGIRDMLTLFVREAAELCRNEEVPT